MNYIKEKKCEKSSRNLIFKILYAYAWSFMVNCLFVLVIKRTNLLFFENFNIGIASIIIGFVAFSPFYKKLFNDDKLVVLSSIIVLFISFVALLIAAELEVEIITKYLIQTLKDFSVIANATILFFSLSDIFKI